MKLSIVLSAQPASFTAISYQGELATHFHKIKELGFDGVELAIRDPNTLNFLEIENFLKMHELVVPAIGTGQVYGEDGLSFTHPDISIRHQAIDRIISHMNIAKKLNAVVIIGLIRGQNVKGVGKEKAEKWLTEALRNCANEDKKIKLAIEPINRYETDLLNTVNESIQFLDRLNLDNVGLLLDTFHMNIEEPSISESIISAGERIFHLHVADSNRWYPGAGHIDFEGIINTLRQLNYNFFLSGEMLPLPDPDTSARKMIEFFRKIKSL